MNSKVVRHPWADLGLLLLGLAGLVYGLSGILILGLQEVGNALVEGASEGGLQLWGVVASAGMMLLGSMAIYRGAHGLIVSRRPEKGKPSLAWLATIALFPISLAGGLAAAAFNVRPDLIVPVSYSVAMSTVALVIVLVARWIGPPITSRRGWAHFLLGLWAAPLLALTLELLMLVPFVVVGLLGLGASAELQSIIPSLMDPSQWQSPGFMEALQPVILRPFTIALGFVYLALIVPLIEEATKTVALWPFLRRGLTSAQAYLGGVLGGVGYALFEALLLNQGGGGWAVLVIGRGGATFMHAVTGGVAGWGLAQARRGEWKRFLLAYGSTIVAHGLWNSSSVGVGLVGLITQTEMDAVRLAVASLSGLGGILLLGTLTVVSVVALPALGVLIKKKGNR